MDNFTRPSEKEEEYFMQQELKKRKKAREDSVKQLEEDEKEKLKKIHWMRCPKCGMEMEEIRYQGIEIDKCLSCGGIYLDSGELDLLLRMDDQSLVRKVLKIFS